jgi:hypothetical protein
MDRVAASVARMERSAIRGSRIPQNSGVPEFCQYQLRKSETSLHAGYTLGRKLAIFMHRMWVDRTPFNFATAAV